MCKHWSRFCWPEQPNPAAEILWFVHSWFDFSLELLRFQNGAKTVNLQRLCSGVCSVLKCGQRYIFKHLSSAEQHCNCKAVVLEASWIQELSEESSEVTLSAWWQQIHQGRKVANFVFCRCEAEWFLGTHYIAVMFWSCFCSNGFTAECLTNLLGWRIVSWLKKLICSNWQLLQSSESCSYTC